MIFLDDFSGSCEKVSVKNLWIVDGKMQTLSKQEFSIQGPRNRRERHREDGQDRFFFLTKSFNPP